MICRCLNCHLVYEIAGGEVLLTQEQIDNAQCRYCGSIKKREVKSQEETKNGNDETPSGSQLPA